jgi:hypothetical protein
MRRVQVWALKAAPLPPFDAYVVLDDGACVGYWIGDSDGRARPRTSYQHMDSSYISHEDFSGPRGHPSVVAYPYVAYRIVPYLHPTSAPPTFTTIAIGNGEMPVFVVICGTAARPRSDDVYIAMVSSESVSTFDRSDVIFVRSGRRHVSSVPWTNGQTAGCVGELSYMKTSRMQKQSGWMWKRVRVKPRWETDRDRAWAVALPR